MAATYRIDNDTNGSSNGVRAVYRPNIGPEEGYRAGIFDTTVSIYEPYLIPQVSAYEQITVG